MSLAVAHSAGTAVEAVLTAHLFGRFSVAVDGHVIDTGASRRVRNMLAYLVLHRQRPIARDVLMEVFWPHTDPRSARNSLHVTLSGVRQALRQAGAYAVLQRRHDTYWISDRVDVWVDVEEFERSCQAARDAERRDDTAAAVAHFEAASHLYRADLLSDDPYLDWASGRRDALRLLAIDSQTRLVDLYVQRGDVGAAMQLGRWLLTSDPCNESVHRQVMRCYASIGQLHLAVAQYRRCVDALWKEFRLRPAAETLTVYRELCAGRAVVLGVHAT